MKNAVLIYGATGYTGRLIALRARDRWLADQGSASPRTWTRPPRLGGRDAQKLEALAKPLDLPWVAASLDDNAAMDAALADVAVVVNAAGPFGTTASKMVKACLRNRVHYLDLCGEFGAFRQVDDYNVDAVQRGVMLMPGAGFLVTGSDFLTARLVRRLPGLHVLRVALSATGMLSRGSFATLLDSTREGMSVRRAGRLVSVAAGQMERTFHFSPDGRSDPATCTVVRLPDLMTAVATAAAGGARLENVETYAEAEGLRRAWYQAASLAALPLQTWPLKQIVQAQIGLLPEAPPAGRDRTQIVVVEGEDRYGGLRLRSRLEAPDPYAFSAWSAVHLVESVLGSLRDRGSVPPGLRTPAGTFFDELAQAMGACDCAIVGDVLESGMGARSHG